MLFLPTVYIIIIFMDIDSIPFIKADAVPVIINIVFTFALLIGIIAIMKLIIIFASELTNNSTYLQIVMLSVAIIIGFFATSSDLGINSDKGVIFEIIGFIVYLTPVKKYLATMIKHNDNENEEHYEKLIKNVAVVLIIFGLLLQLSTYNG